MYKIYGDYGYTTETLLAEFNDFGDAVHWVENYVNGGDFGGYTVIEIATFAENGEYVVERRWDADDWEDQTVFYDEDEDAIFY